MGAARPILWAAQRSPHSVWLEIRPSCSDCGGQALLCPLWGKLCQHGGSPDPYALESHAFPVHDVYPEAAAELSRSFDCPRQHPKAGVLEAHRGSRLECRRQRDGIATDALPQGLQHSGADVLPPFEVRH